MGGYGGQSTMPQEENCQAVHSSTALWHHVRGPRPHQGSDPRKSHGRPFWASIEEGGGRTKHFQGGYVVGLVLKDWYLCLLTHWSS